MRTFHVSAAGANCVCMYGWMDGWVLSVLGAVLHVSRGGVVSHTQRFSRFFEQSLPYPAYS